ncbi:GOLPH3/VPS74 family protein [Streptomyces winkii]|uniref:GOLPH3/VPS74 family protein n=1 Tax=Streptomyces winkii TaxID=3051178 RepID=UPI0028D8A0D8|nr:GPP34 family phosphoprotein [Streptomyces sp. DSM 40971]
MTTPRDLMITAMDVEPSRPVEPGELSLALAGAELIDLMAAGEVALDGDTIVPRPRGAVADRLLDHAAAALVRDAPYESVGDWLWRRGRGLAPAYLTALEADGQLTRRRRRWVPLRTGQLITADVPERQLARDRWASGEPVLATLARTVGIQAGGVGDSPGVADDAVETVLVAVGDASVELEAVRQRRTIEKDAFDNIWRGY